MASACASLNGLQLTEMKCGHAVHLLRILLYSDGKVWGAVASSSASRAGHAQRLQDLPNALMLVSSARTSAYAQDEARHQV